MQLAGHFAELPAFLVFRHAHPDKADTARSQQALHFRRHQQPKLSTFAPVDDPSPADHPASVPARRRRGKHAGRLDKGRNHRHFCRVNAEPVRQRLRHGVRNRDVPGRQIPQQIRRVLHKRGQHMVQLMHMQQHRGRGQGHPPHGQKSGDTVDINHVRLPAAQRPGPNPTFGKAQRPVSRKPRQRPQRRRHPRPAVAHQRLHRPQLGKVFPQRPAEIGQCPQLHRVAEPLKRAEGHFRRSRRRQLMDE